MAAMVAMVGKARARPKLRTRILTVLLVVTAVVIAAFAAAAVIVLDGYLIGQTDNALATILNLSEARLPQLVARADAGQPPPRLARDLGNYYLALVTDGGTVHILDADPALAPRLPGDLESIAAAGEPVTVSSQSGHDTLRLRAGRVAAGTLVVTSSLNQVDSTIGRLEVVLGAGSLAALTAIGIGTFAVIRRGLRPIETMAQRAERIRDGSDLAARIGPGEQGSEVGSLGAALDAMLDRLDEYVTARDADQEATRRFLADASHELRNPLASLRANAELYRQGALQTTEQVDQAMDRIAKEARRMGGLVDDMLALARLDQHPERQSAPVALAPLIDGCVERRALIDPERCWTCDSEPELEILGDEEMLRRSVDNLLANVSAHTPAGTTCHVATYRSDRTIEIDVDDDGPGVAADQRSRIFDRFYRAADGIAPGSGLGLAIVTETVKIHGGAASASSGPSGGLRVALTFPEHLLKPELE